MKKIFACLTTPNCENNPPIVREREMKRFASSLTTVQIVREREIAYDVLRFEGDTSMTSWNRLNNYNTRVRIECPGYLFIQKRPKKFLASTFRWKRMRYNNKMIKIAWTYVTSWRGHFRVDCLLETGLKQTLKFQQLKGMKGIINRCTW